MGKLSLTGAIAAIIAAAVLSAGCASTPSAQLPTANAGPGQTVKVGTTVTLDGSGSTSSNGSTLSYSWSLSSVPTNSSSQLANSTSAHPTFTPDKAGAYVVQLAVTDNTGAQSRVASTTITSIAERSNTTLTVQASSAELYLGQQATISGKLTDANGRGIPNQTISFKVQAHVLVFTTNYPMNDTKTDSTGAFTQTELVSRHDAPSFITNVDLDISAAYGGNELYKPASSPVINAQIHLTSPPSS